MLSMIWRSVFIGGAAILLTLFTRTSVLSQSRSPADVAKELIVLLSPSPSTSPQSTHSLFLRLSSSDLQKTLKLLRESPNRYVVAPDEYASAAFSVAGRQGASQVLPVSVRYPLHEQRDECSQAASELTGWLASLEADQRQREEFYSNHGRGLPEDMQKNYIDITERYDRYCLETGDPATVGVPRERIGVVYYGDDDGLDPPCTAFHLANGVLLTARHCFKFSISRARFLSDSKELVQVTDVWDNGAEGHRAYISRNGPRVPEERDYAFLRGQARSIVYPTTHGIKQDAELRLIAFNLYIHILNNMKNKDRAVPWDRAIRWSKPRTSCYAAFVANNGCIFHGCQTSPAASGSGLTQGETLVGLHLGQVGTDSSTCQGPTEHLKLIGNVGFKLPTAVSEENSWLRKLTKDK